MKSISYPSSRLYSSHNFAFPARSLSVFAFSSSSQLIVASHNLRTNDLVDGRPLSIYAGNNHFENTGRTNLSLAVLDGIVQDKEIFVRPKTPTSNILLARTSVRGWG